MLPIYHNNNANWLPSLFNDILNDWTPAMISNGSAARTAPAFNVIENENNYQVEVAAPGMTKEDFKIHLDEENRLIVRLQKKAEHSDEDKARKYLRREFSYATFEQALVLPDTVDKKSISAAMADGVLTITLPKMTPEQKEAEIKYIDII
ncbi:MAG: Hsp20/alpha crystallin family protein [Bacteroidaceae bacterium]|nr:Hsp20/alpha crystallin family protein [Bacteroidaceae bacterium]